MIKLLPALGDPQKRLHFICVAGDMRVMLEAILQEAGYKTGLYSSSSSKNIFEWIQVNGKSISGERFAALADEVKAMADHSPSLYLASVIAIKYFADAKCDLVLLDAGMRGLVDEKNRIGTTGVDLNLKMDLDDRCQLDDSLVLHAVEILREGGWQVSCDAVQAGMKRVSLLSKPELLSGGPFFILDDSHYFKHAQALAPDFKRRFDGKTVVFLCDLSVDKDYTSMITTWLQKADHLVCLAPSSGGVGLRKRVVGKLQSVGIKVTVSNVISKSIKLALSLAGENGIILAIGPLSFASDLLKFYKGVYRRWLRQIKIQARDSYTKEERARLSKLAVQQIVKSHAFKKAKTILIYRATRGELGLDQLEQAAERLNKCLLFPICISDTEMMALHPHGADSWKLGYFGIWEPIRALSDEVAPEDLDMVICPCTVFDENGSRLGMGAGFYDRYLTMCPQAVVASVAFEVQKTQVVPTEAWDKPMDMVFTENTTYHNKAK